MVVLNGNSNRGMHQFGEVSGTGACLVACASFCILSEGIGTAVASGAFFF